jgi:hypothetical protein
VDLFPLLGGTPDAGGTWTGPGGSNNGTFVPGTSQPGPYVYHVPGIAPCPEATATITVIGAPPSNPGVGDSAWYCFDETAANLNDDVTGEDNTGVWYSPTGLGITFYDQPIDVSSYGSGNYAYVVATPPCPADTAFVYVTLEGPPCTIGIQQHAAQGNRFTVSPNPATDLAVVEIERDRAIAGERLEVLDVNGKLLLRQAIGGTDLLVRRTLDLSGLAPGAYLLRWAGGERTVTQRLMLQ